MSGKFGQHIRSCVLRVLGVSHFSLIRKELRGKGGDFENIFFVVGGIWVLGTPRLFDKSVDSLNYTWQCYRYNTMGHYIILNRYLRDGCVFSH